MYVRFVPALSLQLQSDQSGDSCNIIHQILAAHGILAVRITALLSNKVAVFDATSANFDFGDFFRYKKQGIFSRQEFDESAQWGDSPGHTSSYGHFTS